MTSITFAVLILTGILWIYSFISIFSNEFKHKDEKTFWMIGIVCVPLLAYFYMFRKKDILK